MPFIGTRDLSFPASCFLLPALYTLNPTPDTLFSLCSVAKRYSSPRLGSGYFFDACSPGGVGSISFTV
jgi:hypothetical protein